MTIAALLAKRGDRNRDANFVLGSLAGAALVVDTNDPNTDAPTDARIVWTPNASYGEQVAGLLFADAACTIEGWFYSAQLDRWIRFFTQAIATAFIGIPLTTGVAMLPIPDGAAMFLRITVNGGNAKIAGIFFH